MPHEISPVVPCCSFGILFFGYNYLCRRTWYPDRHINICFLNESIVVIFLIMLDAHYTDFAFGVRKGCTYLTLWLIVGIGPPIQRF